MPGTDESNHPTSSFDADGLQFVWNASSIKLVETCLKKYEYTMIEGWQSKGLSVHLRFGSHFATALEHYYKHRALGMTSAEALREVVKETLEATWDYPEITEEEFTNELAAYGKGMQEQLPDGSIKYVSIIGRPWDSGNNLKTRETLIRSIVWYVDQFENETIRVLHDSNGAPMVEQNFLLAVDDGIMFSGHLDRVVEYAGGTYVMDQKTTGSTISPRFFDQFKPDTQMSMYTWAGKMIFDTAVKGVMIDGAQIAVGFTKFERGFTFRTAAELEEWYSDAMFWIETAREATKAKHFPRNTASCGNYGGCAFRSVCARSPEVRPQFLREDFIQGKPFDPLEQR